MDKVIDHLQSELNTVRTGMANAKMLNKVMVELLRITDTAQPDRRYFRFRKEERWSSSRMIRPV